MKVEKTDTKFHVPKPPFGGWGLFLCVLCAFVGNTLSAQTKPFILKQAFFKHYVDYFNTMETPNIEQAIPNAQAWDWMKKNIPLFECPQQNFEEIFYYRWWTLRKHIKKTRKGFCVYGIFSATQLCS